MRKSGLCLTLLFSLIASIKSVHAEAIMISGKLQADMPAVTFNPGPGDFVAFVNNNIITASGSGTACNVTLMIVRHQRWIILSASLSGFQIALDLLLTGSR